MDAARLRTIARLFGPPALRSLAREGPGRPLAAAVAGLRARPATVGGALEALYGALVRGYRCDYVYRNALAAKVVLARHAPGAATMLGEVRAGARHADLVVLNGTSTAYEIKTGLDSLDRLDAQLAAYRRVFDRVCVVTDEAGADRVARAVRDGGVGIVVLTRGYALSTLREPASRAHETDPAALVDTLRQAEVAAVLRETVGAAPALPNGVRLREWRRLLATAEPRAAHDAMVRALRLRAPGSTRVLRALPHALKAAGYLLSPADAGALLDRLASPLPA